MASLPNFNALLMEGFNTGRELKRQEGERNALAGLVSGDESALGELARYNPQMAFQVRGQQQTQQQAQLKAQREQMGLIAKLTSGVADEASYQQAIAAARSYGLDVANAPPTYDPQWVGQMNTIASALSDEERLPGIAQELQAAGFKPGTPEFQQGLIGIINNKYAAEYVDEQGNTRRRSALNIAPPAGQTQQPQPAPQAQAPQGKAQSARDMARVLQSQGPQGFLKWQQQFGVPVLVTSPEEAAAFPPGTLLVTPDGRTGSKK